MPTMLTKDTEDLTGVESTARFTSAMEQLVFTESAVCVRGPQSLPTSDWPLSILTVEISPCTTRRRVESTLAVFFK